MFCTLLVRIDMFRLLFLRLDFLERGYMFLHVIARVLCCAS